ncbi:hypothetical protein [Streptomyces sp. NPDC054901]
MDFRARTGGRHDLVAALARRGAHRPAERSVRPIRSTFCRLAPPPGTAVVEPPGRGRTLEVQVRAGTETRPSVAAALDALTPLSADRDPAARRG